MSATISDLDILRRAQNIIDNKRGKRIIATAIERTLKPHDICTYCGNEMHLERKEDGKMAPGFKGDGAFCRQSCGYKWALLRVKTMQDESRSPSVGVSIKRTAR